MEERHRTLLIKLNPWWQEKSIQIPIFKRDLFETLYQYFSYKQILAITGLRRTGKTVLLKQLIHSLDVQKKNICYISFDDIDFQSYSTAEDLINYFLEFSNSKSTRFLFLDEVQKLPHWQDLLKVYYDTEENLKIIVTGSSSLELNKKKETLAGRILTFHLPVFTFKEYVRYHHLETNFTSESLIREYDLIFSQKKDFYHELFEEYLIKGAFPELLDINIKDEEYIKKYIKESVIEKTIADIARVTKEDEKCIYELLRLLANSNAHLFEISNIANILDIDRNKASRYIHYLEKAFLIKISYNFTASVAKQVRTSKKQYLVHSSIVLAILDYPFNIITTSISGTLVESVIATHFTKTQFWRSPQKEEIDIILHNNVPVEVKHRTHISKKATKFVSAFCKKFSSEKGIVVTKDILEWRNIGENNILLIPAWLFLLWYEKAI